MLSTLNDDVDEGDKRKSMWTDGEKRQSLLKTNQNEQVKKKKSVNPEELDNIEMLLDAMKYLANKQSLHVEQAVEVDRVEGGVVDDDDRGSGHCEHK